MWHLLTVLIIVPCITGVPKTLPFGPYVTLCRRSSSDFSACMQKAMFDVGQILHGGNKALGLVSLEPFYINLMDLGEAKGGSVTLRQKYSNVKMHGFGNSTDADTDARFDDNNCYWKFRTITPVMTMEADYELDGNILIFPLKSKGKCNVYLHKLNAIQHMKCEKYMKKGKKHIRVYDNNLIIKTEKVVFSFENVIPNNAQLSNEVNRTFNENSAAVFDDVRPGFEKSLAWVHLQAVNAVFSKLSEDELFLD